MPAPLPPVDRPLVTPERIEAGARRLGLHRLTDVTGLDRLGIPVAASIAVTHSADVLSVYNGKGRDEGQARIGALLELIERRSALRRRRRTLRCATWDDLRRGDQPVLDPELLNLPPQASDPHTVPLEWVPAVRLPDQAQILVPANAVFFPYRPRKATLLFRPLTTGLAAGRTWSEAVEHGIAECIERDALSLALLALAAGRQFQPGRLLDLETLPEPARTLARRFPSAGLRLAVRELPFNTEFHATRPNEEEVTAVLPSYLAVSVEEVESGRFRLHLGAASAVDPALAVERAIMEVAQCRLTEIQGIREDLRPESRRDVDGSELLLWLGGIPECFSRTHEQQGDQDRSGSILSSLTLQGLTQVYAVDLTVPSVGVPVVRVIIPGLESWYEDPDRLGSRGRRLLG